jgi:hypothetical protein
MRRQPRRIGQKQTLSPRDAKTVRITYIYGGVCEELIVASAYLPYDSAEPPPTKEMRNIIEYCQSRKRHHRRV